MDCGKNSEPSGSLKSSIFMTISCAVGQRSRRFTHKTYYKKTSLTL